MNSPHSLESKKHFRIDVATVADREKIYRLRHAVYATELGQHSENPQRALSDALDEFNVYLVARRDGEIAGFISITPPTRNQFSVDKYLTRDSLPFACDENLFEVRLLTALAGHRHKEIAPLLMYAALRWIESRGGTRIMAIGREEVLDLYYKIGLRPTGKFFSSGKIQFELLHASVAELRNRIREPLLDRLESRTDWQLGISFRKPASCFHGGTFFSAIGEKFDHLERNQTIINADVLDAWFAPSPNVIAALQEYLPWLLRTSPPNDAGGLTETIAEARGVKVKNILPGAGSSDLIFLAFQRWLNRSARVLILDPIYSEYPHVLEKVIGCRVDRFVLRREENYDIDLEKLTKRLREVRYDLLVLVNPNSPTGRHVRRADLERFLNVIPQTTRVWIDETYVDYVGPYQSLEKFAVQTGNVVICKSMSKVYALSGARVAYLCAPPELLEELRSFTPPWAVSLPAQVSAVNALHDPEYYAARFAETQLLREKLASDLSEFGWDLITGCANFLLAHLPDNGPGADEIIEKCRAQNLFVRNPANMGSQFGNRALRIAVKDKNTNRRMIEILRGVLNDTTENKLEHPRRFSFHQHFLNSI